MDKLNTILIGILVFMFAAAGVYAFAGYSGNDALAVHYMTEQEWSDASCGGCHPGMDEEVAESYHVEQDLNKWTSLMEYGVDVDSIEGEERALTYGQVHPGGGYMEEYGVDLDCMSCHEQNDLYDYEARSEAIASGNFDIATEAALEEARTEMQQEPLYVISYMLDVLTPLPLVTEIHDEVNAGPRAEQCASTCHIDAASQTGVAWADEDYAQYDVHADVNCYECHETEDHQIGSPEVIDAPESVLEDMEGEVKSCDSAGCHEGISHGALVDGHLSAVECETCHIPALPGTGIEGGPVVSSFSWANGSREEMTYDSDFNPTISWYDGIPYNSLPVKTNMSEDSMLKPFNIITGVWWDEGLDAEVATNPNTSSAIGNPIAPSIVLEADQNSDSEVTVDEIRSFDGNSDGNPDYPNAVLRHVEMYFPVSHNIAGSNTGLAEPLVCADCHGSTATAIDWEGLGYGEDPAGADSDFTGSEIEVSIPDQAPTEVEREPAF